MNNPAILGGRLSRQEWLRRALEVLAEAGPAKLTIQDLSETLGVSRGSFYWHFKNREDFVLALLDFWHDEYTTKVPAAVEAQGGTGRDKFRSFLRLVREKNLVQYDMPIRSWAMQDPDIAERVHRTDEFRLDFLRGLLAEIGFSGSTQEIRARSCIAYLTMDKRMPDPGGALTGADNLDELCDFFIGID